MRLYTQIPHGGAQQILATEKCIERWVVGISQSAESLPCEPEDLSLTPGTCVESYECGGVCL